ncbi:hypothetical protein MTO96_045994 [Rhipicephalus appendiculatus]
MTDDDMDVDFSPDVFHALAANKTITHLVVHLDNVERPEKTTALSYMFVDNRTVPSATFWFATDGQGKFVREVSQGMSLNRIAVQVTLLSDTVTCDAEMFPAFGAWRRNIAALNRVTDFVPTHLADTHLRQTLRPSRAIRVFSLTAWRSQAQRNQERWPSSLWLSTISNPTIWFSRESSSPLWYAGRLKPRSWRRLTRNVGAHWCAI